jgi:haloalkane dehalogenase
VNGSTSIWPVRPAWVPDDLYPFEDRWLEIDGHRVHFV